MNELEIFTDASIRKFPNGRVFGCSGAMNIMNADESYTIFQDVTNNRAELLAIYMGIRLGHKQLLTNPNLKYIVLYSDSQFGIFGLTKWLDSWMSRRDSNGVMYGTNSSPVKNQDIFACILVYIACNRIPVKFLHCSGHVRMTSQKMLAKSNETFKKANGFYLRPEEVYKAAYYNELVDQNTRALLNNVNPDDYPIIIPNEDYSCYMRTNPIPSDYKQFIL
jgi:ribonuclease HI